MIAGISAIGSTRGHKQNLRFSTETVQNRSKVTSGSPAQTAQVTTTVFISRRRALPSPSSVNSFVSSAHWDLRDEEAILGGPCPPPIVIAVRLQAVHTPMAPLRVVSRRRTKVASPPQNNDVRVREPSCVVRCNAQVRGRQKHSKYFSESMPIQIVAEIKTKTWLWDSYLCRLSSSYCPHMGLRTAHCRRETR